MAGYKGRQNWHSFWHVHWQNGVASFHEASTFHQLLEKPAYMSRIVWTPIAVRLSKEGTWITSFDREKI